MSVGSNRSSFERAAW